MGDQISRLGALCSQANSTFARVFVLNSLFLAVLLAALVMGAMLYRQNRRDYNNAFNKRKRLRYFYVVKHGSAKRNATDRQV